MLMRFVHLIVVAALVAAAVGVYTLKFESTLRAAHASDLAAQIKRQRDATAALRAEWVQLTNPARIQALVERHLALRMLDPAQIEHLDRLPERPVAPVGPQPDAIATLIDALEPEPLAAAPAGRPLPYPPPLAGEGREGGATRSSP